MTGFAEADKAQDKHAVVAALREGGATVQDNAPDPPSQARRQGGGRGVAESVLQEGLQPEPWGVKHGCFPGVAHREWNAKRIPTPCLASACSPHRRRGACPSAPAS